MNKPSSPVAEQSQPAKPSQPAGPLVHPQPNLRIRPIDDQEGFAACVELQRSTWGGSYSDVVPASMMQVTTKMGGVLLGAFDSGGGLAGFVYGVTGFRHGAPAHWSHMLAVRPEARNLGVGQRLKQRQRKALLAMGVPTMYWTFDPLVSRNAHLNLNRLGARVAEYVPEMYGASDSDLHDLGTDRFVVEWRLDEEPGDSGRPEWTTAHAQQREAVEVAIPADIEAVKARSVKEALWWRDSTREAFMRLLAEGQEVVAFVPGPEQSKYVVAPRQPAGEGRSQTATKGVKTK